ncbi:MAG: fumarylacetoacetate hydrolase family protein [SAR202 cluster bacterium]|nr:fumarylacetoacetate hydrolase family protein [SAR202 cluster bacterium]MDP6513031.1 fumarylacetoacetate hydrolase family protein [SAR202 cluster bacterium]MDP6713566.1 fumarylacetoacetate hydrolase family protein [SAR202 cluster bacterium]
MNKTQQAGMYLVEHLISNAPPDLMLQDFAPTDMDEAYAVQAEYLKIRSKAKGALGGYKVGLTNPLMQKNVGVDEPCAGGIFARDVVDSPATLNRSDHSNLAVECEVAFTMGSDLPASEAPFSHESAAAAVESIATSFEIVDLQGSEMREGQSRAVMLVSLNVAQAGAVLGKQVSDWRSIDLKSARGVAKHNGEIVGEGVGADVMGHPMEPLVWLANLLAQRGDQLLKGQVILTGSFVTPISVAAGDSVSFEIEGLGDVHVEIK